MVKKIKSQSLGVNTLYSPLSAELSLQLLGGVNPSANKQWYYPNATGTSQWVPNYAVTSLFIKPVVTVADPETAQSYTPPYQTMWTEVKNDASLIQMTTTSVTTSKAKKSNTFSLAANCSYEIRITVSARSASGSTTTAEVVNSSNTVIATGQVTNTGVISISLPTQQASLTGCSVRVVVSSGTSTLSATVDTYVSKSFNSNVIEGGSTVYTLSADGTLEVSKNVYPDAPITLTCTVTYTDSRNGKQGKLADSMTLTASLASESEYTLKFGTSDTTDKTDYVHQYYNPLADGASPVVYIKAQAFLGDTDVTSDMKFYWYHWWEDSSHNRYKDLVDDADNPCAAYLAATQPTGKGQGHEAIALNADYDSENLEIEVRIGSSTSSQPMANIFQRATVRWKIPNVNGNVYSMNGDTANGAIQSHTFGVLYRQGKDDVPDSVSSARIHKRWRLKKANANKSTEQVLGCGHTMKVEESKLLDSGGNQAIVSADGYILSPYTALTVTPTANVGDMIAGTEYIIKGYTSNSDDRLVVGRHIDVD